MEMTEKSHKIPAVAALVFTALIWGSTFVMMKNTLGSLSPAYLLAIRFVIASVFLFLIFIGKIKMLSLSYIIPSAIAGFLTVVAYLFQTYGLKYTTPGKNAFLTSIYCIIVPFLYWIFVKRKPGWYNFLAAAVCVVGVGLVSMDFADGFSIGIGEILTLCCSVFYALQIMYMARCSKKLFMGLFVALHFAFATVFSLIFTLIFEKNTFSSLSSEMLPDILYLALFASAIALFLQNYGIKYCSASSGALILSLESVFGVIFSAIAGMEDAFTLQKIVGFVLVFASIIISETKLEFLMKKKSKTEPSS